MFRPSRPPLKTATAPFTSSEIPTRITPRASASARLPFDVSSDGSRHDPGQVVEAVPTIMTPNLGHRPAELGKRAV